MVTATTRRCATLACLATLAIAFLVGCDRRSLAILPTSTGSLRRELVMNALRAGQQFEVLSIDPFHSRATDDSFHGYPVLGRVALADDAERRRLIIAISQSAFDPDEMSRIGACLFMPRHGLRVIPADGVPTDFVLCFSCLESQMFGPKSTSFVVDKSAETILSYVLRTANVPIVD